MKYTWVFPLSLKTGVCVRACVYIYKCMCCAVFWKKSIQYFRSQPQRFFFIISTKWWSCNILTSRWLFYYCLAYAFHSQSWPAPHHGSRKFWNISNMQSNNISMADNGNTQIILPIFADDRILNRSYFCFYTTDGHSSILAVVLLGPQYPIISSANNVSHDVILNFTRDSHGTMMWYTATTRTSQLET